MGIPKKGLRRKQLRDLTAGNAVIDGSHPIIQVEFIEDGVKKVGFFKELEPKRHYPEHLAKIGVGTSHLHRTYLGTNCAEERLVFDDNDRIVGTLSIAIDGFKPFNYAGESVPTDLAARERVIPSTKTLIERNFMASAFAYWFGDNDDGHPHNHGFALDQATAQAFDMLKYSAVILDFDMFNYWYTILMKEARPVIGVPKKRVALTVRSWETLPIDEDSKHYHNCTYKHPGEVTLPVVLPLQSPLLTHVQVLPKQFADPTQFVQLASEPQAHEQKFAIAIRALLTFQPEVVRARLVEQFGDMPLNYTSLDDSKVDLRVSYEKEFPNLCNETTNTQPFVDFMMNMYQQHYDNLYRVVVFYMGCENNGYGVSLKSTCSSLYLKPSVFRNIEEWMQKQNDTLYGKDDAGIKFDLVQLKKRYHQIWRDAYAPTLKELLHYCYQLTNKSLVVASSKSAVAEVTEVEGKTASDDSLVSAWELIGAMPELSREKIEPLIRVNENSRLKESALLLLEFTQQFHAIAKAYYIKERKDLTEEDNLTFIRELERIYREFDLPLREALSHTSSDAKEYNRIAGLLEQFMKQVSFKHHLTTTDEQMRDTITVSVAKEELPHTHPDVIVQYNDALFKWADGIKSEDLASYINDIIDTHYAPYLESLSKRHRTQPVKDYLSTSHGESGANRLAYILSSGNDEGGALNTLLIKHLTPHMLTTYPLLSVRNAVRDGSFNKDLSVYTKATATFAKTDKRFFHLYNTEGIQLFYKTIYDWVEALPRKPTFEAIVGSALTDYEKNLWWGNSRRAEVRGYFEANANNAQVLSMIFLKGTDGSTLNETLFQKIIAGMKSEISKSMEKQQVPGNRLVMQYNHKEHTGVYGGLKLYAVAPSHRQVTPKETTALTLM